MHCRPIPGSGFQLARIESFQFELPEEPAVPVTHRYAGDHDARRFAHGQMGGVDDAIAIAETTDRDTGAHPGQGDPFIHADRLTENHHAPAGLVYTGYRADEQMGDEGLVGDDVIALTTHAQRDHFASLEAIRADLLAIDGDTGPRGDLHFHAVDEDTAEAGDLPDDARAADAVFSREDAGSADAVLVGQRVTEPLVGGAAASAEEYAKQGAQHQARQAAASASP